MSRFLVLNFQDFGLDHHIQDTIKSHTVFCVCCLAKDVPLIDLDKCKHAHYLDNFNRPEMDKYKNAICSYCHFMLKRIDMFRKQVEQSFFTLNQITFKINNASTLRKPVLETKKVVNIYLPPRRSDAPQPSFTHPPAHTIPTIQPKPVDSIKPVDNIKPVEEKAGDSEPVKSGKIEIVIEPIDSSDGNVPVDTDNDENSDAEEPAVETQQTDEDPLQLNDNDDDDSMSDGETVNVKTEPNEEISVTETEIQEVIPRKKRVLVVTLTKEELNRERVSCAQNWSYLKYKHRCEHCLIGFMYSDNLRDHQLRRHYARVDGVTCEVCTQVISPAGGLNAHMFRHYTRYECEECHKRFQLFNDALTHYRKTHETESAGYQCNNCDYNTTKHNESILHKLKHQRFTCTDCGLLFTSKTGYRRHLNKIHKKSVYKCVRCGTEHESMNSYVAHMMGHGERPSCDVCNASFKTWHSYGAHLKLSAAHNPKNKYRCGECGMRFAAAVYLRIHTQQRHSHLRSHQCKHCKKAFTLSIELKRHIKKIHNEAHSKLIVCDHCGRAYGSRNHLIKHINDAHNSKTSKKKESTIATKKL